MNDSEIVKAREVSLKEQIEHYNKRRKTVFDNYYRRNTEGSEDTLEICVLRESAVLISKLESIINRLQAENERLNFLLNDAYENNRGLVELLERAKSEAYKEFAERLKIRFSGTLQCSGWLIQKVAEDILEELVD